MKDDLYDKISKVRSKIEQFKQYIDSQEPEPEPEVKPEPIKEDKANFVSFSTWTIIKVSLIAFCTYFFIIWLGSIADILLILFAALVIASAFSPIADYFQKYHIPRAVTVLFIYISFFLMFGFTVSSIIPFLIEQLTAFATVTLDILRNVSNNGFDELPYGDQLEFLTQYMDKEAVIAQLQDSLQNAVSTLGDFSGSFLSLLSGILGNVFRAIIVLVLTFYMILDKDAISEFFKSITTGPHQAWLNSRASEIIVKMGDWLRGQTLLSLSVGVTAYIGLLIIGNPFALTLGFLTVLLEFVPYIGPILAGLIAVLVSLSISPLAAMLTIALFVVIQFLENNILVPMIMRKTVGLSPVVTIFAVLVAVKLIGGPGIILAIPIAAAVSVIVNSLRN